MRKEPHESLEEALQFYILQCNDLGARVLRLQEEQSRWHREARRSKTTAKLIREAYRLVNINATIEVVVKRMLDIVIDTVICDRAAILRFESDEEQFIVDYALGFGDEPRPSTVSLARPPDFFFTTSETENRSPANELISILNVPYILWAFDPASGYALILGNQSEANVARPFEPDDRQIIEGALNVFVDVVERTRTEAELRRAKVVAEEASKAKSSFLANLSHELRTPLNAIIGFSQMIRDEAFGPLGAPKYREYIDGICTSGQHLLSLINDILDYSRVDAGKDQLFEEVVDLRAAIASALVTVEPAAQNAKIALSTDVGDNLPYLVSDARRIRQILINLLANSVKFTKTGGRISVHARLEADGSILVQVSDTGVGIAAEDIPLVLEPFGQAGSIYSRAQSGSGLGLPLSKALVERHEGSLTIDSVLEHGTTVNIRFPKHRTYRRDTRQATTH